MLLKGERSSKKIILKKLCEERSGELTYSLFAADLGRSEKYLLCVDNKTDSELEAVGADRQYATVLFYKLFRAKLAPEHLCDAVFDCKQALKW